MKIAYTAVVVTSSLVYGCSSSPRPGSRPQPVADIDTTPAVSSVSTWTISPTETEQRYQSITGSLLETADVAGITRDSITTTVDFVLSIKYGQEPLSYSATVESMSARGGQKTGITTNTQLPFSFTARLDQGRITVDPPAGQTSQSYVSCSNEALSATGIIQRVVVRVPLALHRDMSWTDSTTASTCSGSIPVITTMVRRYRVVGETTGTPGGILLERQDRTLSAGEGSQGQHRVRLRSDGSGTAQVIVDSRTGAVLESNGVHIASVVVTASGRDQKFTQRTRERIVRQSN